MLKVLIESCQPDNNKDTLSDNNLVLKSEPTENFVILKVFNVGLTPAYFPEK